MSDTTDAFPPETPMLEPALAPLDVAGSDAPPSPQATDPTKRTRPYRKRPQWDPIRLAYIQGMEVDGELVFPTHEELCATFHVSPRQVAKHAKEQGWLAKRKDYIQTHAVQAHRLKVGRLLKEMEKFEGTSLVVARVAMQEVVRWFNHYGQLRQAGAEETIPPGILEKLMRTAVIAQKIGRLALNLPTELIDASDSAQRREAEVLEKLGVDRDDRLTQWLEKINALEGDDFLRAIDALMDLPRPPGPRSVALTIEAGN